MKMRAQRRRDMIMKVVTAKMTEMVTTVGPWDSAMVMEQPNEGFKQAGWYATDVA